MQEGKGAGAVTHRGAVKSARERVLETATELFYREGIRAVGIDRVIAESGVAKMSLYRNFASKEDLVLAFLIESDRGYWQRWDQAMAQHAGDPRQQLRDLFAMLARRVRRPGYRGCPFINTATEFPDPRDRARAFCHAHKRQLSQRLRDLACAVGARDPEMLADQLHLLIEGAYSSAQTLGAPRAGLEAAAEALVEAHLAKTSLESARKRKIRRG
jgi:AcrR family transcriptional regulator